MACSPKRIFGRRRNEEGDGDSGHYTQVNAAVRELRQRGCKVFLPLVHGPGEAHVDFGVALVNLTRIDGETGTIVWRFNPRQDTILRNRRHRSHLKSEE